jgi:hypothetical protein
LHLGEGSNPPSSVTEWDTLLFQEIDICEFSDRLIDNYLDKRADNLSDSETMLLARLPCFGLDDEGQFDRVVRR